MYQQLVGEGVITPAPEFKPPEVPMDLDYAKKTGKVGCLFLDRQGSFARLCFSVFILICKPWGTPGLVPRRPAMLQYVSGAHGQLLHACHAPLHA